VPVKPLKASSLTPLLVRLDHLCGGDLCSITTLSPTSLSIRFSVQDSARGYDWIDIQFVVSGVSNAKLVSDNVLSSLDMSEGITVEINANTCALAIGAYKGRVNEAPLYIMGTSMAYEELPFSG